MYYCVKCAHCVPLKCSYCIFIIRVNISVNFYFVFFIYSHTQMNFI